MRDDISSLTAKNLKDFKNSFYYKNVNGMGEKWAKYIF